MVRKALGFFTYENMLKSIAAARSECTTKHENKSSYNTDYIILDLIDFLGDDWKEIRTQIEKKKFVLVKNVVLTNNWFVVSVFHEFPEHRMKKYCSGYLYFLLKTKAKFTIFITF